MKNQYSYTALWNPYQRVIYKTLIITHLAGALIFLLAQSAQAQVKDPKATEVWDPVPRKITPGEENSAPPSDAIVLFDGTNLNEWASRRDNGAAKWTVADGIVTVKPGTGDIITRRKFGDIQLHLEWRSPQTVESEGQGRGNSGVFLQERYEIQILDSYESRTYSNGQAGAIYKQSIPLVNATRPHTDWETYDIIYSAPVFNEDGIKVKSAYITVIHNGVVIQNHQEVLGTTEYIGFPKNEEHGKGSIILQDHSNTVSFRNIWLREL